MMPNENALKARELDIFVGIWNTTGRIHGDQDSGDQLLVATDTYEWLPGKCFLLHRVDARLGDQISRSIEIIGWDAEANQIVSTSYGDDGSTSRFRCLLDGNSWQIDGDTMRFRGGFDDRQTQLLGNWELANEHGWLPWMEISLTKAD
jgi:hypothetical protein